MPTSVAAYLEKNGDVWDRIVAKCDLRSRNLRQLVGQGDQHAGFAFAYGAPEGPRAFVSTIKLRQAGFAKTIDTEDSFRNALQSLIDHKLLPPARTDPDVWMCQIPRSNQHLRDSWRPSMWLRHSALYFWFSGVN
jgi:hypothetical protein